MFRKAATYFLIIYISAIFLPAFTLIHFSINQEEIIEEFCVNKDKPELNCNGQCHLTEVLANQVNEDSGIQEQSIIELPFFLGKIIAISIPSCTKQNVVNIYVWSRLYHAVFLDPNFPPPRVNV